MTGPGRVEALPRRRSPRDCNLCGAGVGREIFVKRGFSIRRCPTCDLVYVGDPPEQGDLRHLYSFDAGYHTSYGDDGAGKTAWHLRSARDCYALLTRHKAAGRLLDVGCSAGVFLRVARDHGWEVCGVEMSSDTAAVARDRHGLAVSAGTLEEVAYPPKSFDAVTLWDVIEHVPDPVGTMSIVHRILKDDGIVAFLTPNVEGLFPRLSYLAARFIHYWPHPEPPHHLFQFSKRTARRLASTTGFTVREVIDRRIPLAYTFGGVKGLLRRPDQLLYAATFAPLAFLGPFVGAGDAMVVIAQKSSPAGGGAP